MTDWPIFYNSCNLRIVCAAKDFGIDSKGAFFYHSTIKG
jgi:hypothetical protein